jgi:probable F420-dependent oxidoreductase
MAPQLGRYGVWGRDVELSPDLAAGLEQLGYGTVWVGGSPSGDLSVPDLLLAATEELVVATGIVNIWQDDAATVARSYHRLEGRYPGRFVLGIGAGHREATDEYVKPYDALQRYLDILDGAEVPVGRRVLAALGPRVLRLAAERAAGAHPYFTTPDHTREARGVLGPDRVLAPEQKAVLDADPAAARALARRSTTSADWASRTPTSPTGAATGCWTRSSPTVISPRSHAASSSTSTRGRTTSPSSCSPRRARTRSTATASWPGC